MKEIEAFTVLHPDEHGHAPRTFYGSLREHKVRLQTFNDMGYNIFFTVNLTDGQGRRAENITKVRSVFADFDKGLPRDFILKPSLVVQSSPGKYQAYWSIDGWSTDFARWGRIERSLVKKLGADPNAADIARILRVPGMLNHKYAPAYRVNVTEFSPVTYNLDALATAFGEDTARPYVKPGVSVPADLPANEERSRRFGAWLSAVINSNGWPGQGARNGALYYWAAKGVCDFACDPGDVEELLTAAWNLHDRSGDDPRIEGIVRNAERSASGVKGSAYAEIEFEVSPE